jgi:hypothetical protein
MSERPRRPALLALALVTAATLALQVVLTRIFSSVLAYHFSFLAISLAMFGTGAGALLLAVRPAWFQGAAEVLLARWAAVCAALLVGVPFLLVRLDYSSGKGVDLGLAMNLALACLLAALPFFAAGVVVALAIDRYRARLGTVYAYDLIGAGVGSIAIVPALWLASAPRLMVALGALVAAAAVLFGPGLRPIRTTSLATIAFAAAIVLLPVFDAALYLDPGIRFGEHARKVAEHWTPLARVFGYELGGEHPGGYLIYDRAYAPVPGVRDGRLPTWRELGTGPMTVGYELTGPGRALIIGVGGGRDVYTALTSGQWPVDAIELSEGNRMVVEDDLGHFSGRPYSRDGVSTAIGDGRSALATRATLYDQIHIGFTDTLSANAAQGFALTENNLYTVEAFDGYFAHLKPRGILNVSRLLKLVGDEALRATVLTLAALARLGVADPLRHVIVVGGTDVMGPPTGTILARREPFTAQEVARARSLAGERGTGLLLAPGEPPVGDWKRLAEAPSLQVFCDGHHLNVCPPTDDRPFFFNMERLTRLGAADLTGYHYAVSPSTVLLWTLTALLGLSAIGFVVPMAAMQRADRPSVASLAYFAGIGTGFLVLEIVLVQRFVLFLGFPTYALSVVLCTLLIASGLGAELSARIVDLRARLTQVLAALGLLLLLGAFALQPLLGAQIALPFAARVAVSVALLAPHGLLLGMCMPLGLRRMADVAPAAVPYAWGVNGLASVLASVLGIAVAVHLGFTAATLFALACYVAAAATIPRFFAGGTPAAPER